MKDLLEGEILKLEVLGNLWRGLESVGGKIKVTNKRLIFTAHAFNLQTQPLLLNLSDIVEVKKTNSLLIIPNGLSVRTKDGQTYHFVTWSRAKIITMINSK